MVTHHILYPYAVIISEWRTSVVRRKRTGGIKEV